MRFCSITILFFLLQPLAAKAQALHPSPTVTGGTGLVSTPTARTEPEGTITLHTGVAGHYLHGALGLQIAEPLWIGLRQTAYGGNLASAPDRFLPGTDIRIRIGEENRLMPAIVIGLQSAFGHKKTAGEFLAVSKRYEHFDFTAGLGWGRMGGGHFKNPLSFDRDRGADGDMPNTPDNWFSGETMGVFGGIEYATPIKSISLKGEWNGQAAFGIDWHPVNWLSAGVGLAGGDTVTASLTLKPQIKQWPGRARKRSNPLPILPDRKGNANLGRAVEAATTDDTNLYAATAAHTNMAAFLESDGLSSLPRQIGRAIRALANHGGADTEEFKITSTFMGLRGPSLRLIRRDAELALGKNQGSPEEMWRHVEITETPPDYKTGWWQHLFGKAGMNKPSLPRLALDTQASLTEEDQGILYRTSLILDQKHKILTHVMMGGAVRLNLTHNLDNLNELRPRAFSPVRGDVDRFAAQRIGMDRLYLSWLSTPRPGLHVVLTTGQLEEMYSGLGGEILYRPYGKRFAIGADVWNVYKRDPETNLNLGLTSERTVTGHINAWYEISGTDLTVRGSVGRYLASDLGATLALEKRTDNGIAMEAFATATNQDDFDSFDGTTHIYSGIRLRLPLGNVKFIPEGSEIRTSIAPLGRNTGQRLDQPLHLYDMTEQFSARHVGGRWGEITE